MRQPAPAIPLPDVVVSRLTALWHLEDLPLHALIPDARMLPPESLRFFCLDPNWMRALLAGAFSVARSSSDQLAGDATALTAFLFGLADVTSLDAIPVRAGVFLRSAVVSGWPKMRVAAYDATGAAVTLQRRVILGKDVLFMHFAGPIARIELSEPAEGVHFGIERDGSKNLRFVTGEKAGSGTDFRLHDLPRRAGSTSVLDVRATRSAIADAAKNNGLNRDAAGAERAFGPAEFAVEMIQGVELVEISLEDPIV